jgi:hypothetical protein
MKKDWADFGLIIILLTFDIIELDSISIPYSLNKILNEISSRFSLDELNSALKQQKSIRYIFVFSEMNLFISIESDNWLIFILFSRLK